MTIQPALGDILFVSPTIINGDEDAVPYVSDVLVSGGRIAAIGKDLAASHTGDARRIEAKGLVLSPGFIDLHAHSDLYLLTHPEHTPKITQGVTTEIVGQDGISYSPIRNPHELDHIRKQIEGWNGNPSDEECRTTLAGVGMFEWQSTKDYLDCLERNKTATNVATLCPQGNLRLLACGPNDTPATLSEILDQRALLRAAMEEGAIGMSSGLTYTPGMYASTAELASLCEELATFQGAYYAPHHRSYGKNALEAYEEMLQLGRDTGVAVHLTHATMNYAENRGKGQDMLDLVDKARRDGVDVTLDTYPYLPGSTTLSAMLPSYAHEGGPSVTLDKLQDPASAQELRKAVEKGCDGGHGLPIDWTTIELSGVANPELSSYSGKTIAQIAQAESKPPGEVFIDVLVRDQLRTSIIMHVGDEANVRCIMQHETHCGGSDAILHGARCHPRAWGTFPRFLGHYSRDLGLIKLPEMVAHITSRPAKRMGVYPSRGVVREKSHADLVLWNPETIKDMATFENPVQQSRGIEFVLVNGVVAVDGGCPTGARGGRTLRRKADGSVTAGGK